MAFIFCKEHLRLYYVAGSQDFGGDDKRFLGTLAQALSAGVSCFQFRDKGAGSLMNHRDRQADLAHLAKALCHEHGVPFIINDDIVLAKNVGADGIHLGQNDIRHMDDHAMQMFKQHFDIVGLSINHADEALAFQTLHERGVIDYFGIGPIFATPSKDDHSVPVGLDFPKVLRHLGIRVPLVAIGGVKAIHVKTLRENGADGVAVISAISHAEHVNRAVAELLT